MNKLKQKAMVYMAKKMIACEEAGYLASYRLDNRLGMRQWWQLRMHLLTCHLCRKYARQLKELEQIMERYRECSAGACRHHLADEAEKRIRETVSGELNAS